MESTLSLTTLDKDPRILPMDQPLDSVSIVVEHKYNRVQAQLQHIGERLHGQVQATFTGDKNTPLVMVVLSNSFERSHCGASGISNRSEYRLVVHAGATGKLRAAKSECGCACFPDDKVAVLEELAQGLGSC